MGSKDRNQLLYCLLIDRRREDIPGEFSLLRASGSSYKQNVILSYRAPYEHS